MQTPIAFYFHGPTEKITLHAFYCIAKFVGAPRSTECPCELNSFLTSLVGT